MNIIINFLSLLVISIPAWCRRRNVGIMTWAFRMIPLLAILDSLVGCSLSGFIWILELLLYALIKGSLLLAGATVLLSLVICGIIAFWPGWRLKMPGNRWLRGILWGAYSCFSILMAAGFALFTMTAIFTMWMSWQFRVIDRLYATQGEMAVSSPRPGEFARWLPSGAKGIHYHSDATYGRVEERLTCYCDEADLVRYAVEHSYPLATNSFVMLDYYIPEHGSLQPVEERMSKDAETQQRLVFGDRPLPERFISLTQSHEFDGGAVGGSWRVILVLDRDTGEMSGYHWATWM